MIALYRFLKPFTRIIALLVALIFLQTMADLYLPTLMADIVNKGIIPNDTGYIARIGGVMLAITTGGMVCALASSFLAARVALGFGRIVRKELFTQVEKFSLQELDTFGASTLITRTTNDVTQVQLVTVIILRMLISAPIMCVGGIVLALSKDPPLTLVLVFFVPILVIVIWSIARKTVPLFQLMQDKLDHVNRVLREGLTGIRVIRAFNRNDHEQRRFTRANADLMDNAVQANRIMALLLPSMMLIMNLTSVAVIWFGAQRINAGDMDIGALIAFTQYALQIMFAFLMVAMIFVMIPRAAAAARRIDEVLKTSPVIIDPVQPRSLINVRGLVQFHNVTFRYPGAEYPALNNISFTAQPGSITAIIGGTGSGKSTLINLLMRFYDIESGSVCIDGYDIREIPQAELRSFIGLVPQKSSLFTGTISDNVRFGKSTATEQEILHAATIAQATEFVEEMHDGFSSSIAQGGRNVSGGQKQRLSIARALVRKPEILLFDDSFSALDFKTDAQLRRALRREVRQSTIIVVAQRVATIMDADHILVLDSGSIVGAGSHQELMTTCQVYREIVSSQLSESEIA